MIVAWGDAIGLRPFHDPISETEIAQLYAWSRDAELLQLSGGSRSELSLTEFAERLRHDHRAADPNRQVFMILTRAGKLIGRIGCFAIDPESHSGELGIVIGDRDFWGRGYGRDAVITLLRHLFTTTSLQRVYLFTFQENVRAQKAFAACGFRNMGTARKFLPDLGEFDGIEMEITRAEFSAKHSRPASILPRASEMTNA
ncbi:MAG: GNAT family N-acetyltransferase [Chloroflexi bacterium]|nr:GNAT family N-acetyltransferase [Chloroflexota bacterium]